MWYYAAVRIHLGRGACARMQTGHHRFSHHAPPFHCPAGHSLLGPLSVITAADALYTPSSVCAQATSSSAATACRASARGRPRRGCPSTRPVAPCMPARAHTITTMHVRRLGAYLQPSALMLLAAKRAASVQVGAAALAAAPHSTNPAHNSPAAYCIVHTSTMPFA